MVTYFKNIWLGIYTVLIGMKITIDHMFRKNVTVQYPNVHPTVKASDDKMPENARNRLFLDIDLCNGCNGCVRACPVGCITVDTVKVTPGDPDTKPLKNGDKRGLWVTNFQIDFAKCCFCALCVEPCPTEAIYMTNEFEYSTYDRNSLLYTFSIMTSEEGKSKEEMYKAFLVEKKKKEAEEKAKAAAAKSEIKPEPKAAAAKSETKTEPNDKK